MSRAKHEVVYEDLLEKLRAGDLRPGDRLPTERELSSTYGFHRNTVRQAVTRLAVNGLVEKRKPRGFYVRPGVEAERVGSRLSLIYGPTDSAQASAFVQDGVRAAHAHGRDPRIVRMMPGDEHLAVAAIGTQEPSLVIGAQANPLNEVRQAMVRSRSTCASLGVRLDHAGVRSVVGDDELGARLCVQHLVEAGHRRIGLVAQEGGAGSPTLEIQVQHWVRAMEGVRNRSELQTDVLRPRPAAGESLEEATFRATLARFRRKREHPTALVAIGEEVAYAVAGGATRAGLSLPRDLSIVANGGTDRCAFQPLAMTALDCRIRDHVDAAIGLLLREGEPADDDLLRVIRPVLVERESVAPPRR
ncbi:GntR family transcriptional regulator [Phycisphaera mikurensis]|uniref:Putative GntR family transcriptional regulator n=1 Tax=Phycisphaera mikurensis (strain NBRC 102666 / KCTC 22515 / FYK2301M01) TaxID=1142394 RepID=I0IFB6_PHYMF|nr:GntR family transcriptional regulator [Phycisphaera mikurensis]MBB6440653.1 DNA-binding LacI/PurR family transcriptional regulator [Phycisphaera mikurensis]BAM03954.1 putative GntR family transcriptional regulator [Phycisphaera mikurensis NBRC 102666]